MILAYSGNIKEQRATTPSFVVIIEPLVFSSHTEGLTGKSCKANIKRRYILFSNLCYIPGNLKKIFGIVCSISPLRRLIPFRHKNSLNILTEGIDLRALKIGTTLRIGIALCEVSYIPENSTSRCVMTQKGIFARVLEDGFANVGDAVSVL